MLLILPYSKSTKHDGQVSIIIIVQGQNRFKVSIYKKLQTKIGGHTKQGRLWAAVQMSNTLIKPCMYLTHCIFFFINLHLGWLNAPVHKLDVFFQISQNNLLFLKYRGGVFDVFNLDCNGIRNFKITYQKTVTTSTSYFYQNCCHLWKQNEHISLEL